MTISVRAEGKKIEHDAFPLQKANKQSIQIQQKANQARWRFHLRQIMNERPRI